MARGRKKEKPISNICFKVFDKESKQEYNIGRDKNLVLVYFEDGYFEIFKKSGSQEKPSYDLFLNNSDNKLSLNYSKDDLIIKITDLNTDEVFRVGLDKDFALVVFENGYFELMSKIIESKISCQTTFSPLDDYEMIKNNVSDSLDLDIL